MDIHGIYWDYNPQIRTSNGTSKHGMGIIYQGAISTPFVKTLAIFSPNDMAW